MREEWLHDGTAGATQYCNTPTGCLAREFYGDPTGNVISLAFMPGVSAQLVKYDDGNYIEFYPAGVVR